MHTLHIGSYTKDIVNVLLQNKDKGDRGENILCNIVGDKGGLGGGHCVYCLIMCNTAPVSVSRTIFFSDTSTHPRP